MNKTNLPYKINRMPHVLRWVFRTKRLRNHLDLLQIGEVGHHQDQKQVRVSLD